MGTKIYVAGPVLRDRPKDRTVSVVEKLYARLRSDSAVKGVHCILPEFDPALAVLTARQFSTEIHRRILEADAMIALIVGPQRLTDYSPYSIAIEAHHASIGKIPLALVTERSLDLPRMLRALVPEKRVYAFEELRSFTEVLDDLEIAVAALRLRTAIDREFEGEGEM